MKLVIEKYLLIKTYIFLLHALFSQNMSLQYHKIVIETIANASSKICKIISINQNRTINESKLTESKQFNNANEKKTSKDESTDSTKEEGVISMQELSVMCAATSCVNTLTYWFVFAYFVSTDS